MVGLLTALPKTPLYERLEKEGRLLPEANGSDNTKLGTNILPKRMQYDDMVAAYRDLHGRLLADHGIANRIKNKYRYLATPVRKGEYFLQEQLTVFRNVLIRGILRGGASREFHFLRSMPWSRPRLIPLAVGDWVIGLAMRDYADRHFARASGKHSEVIRGHLGSIERAFRRHLQHGELEVSLDEVRHAVANVSVRLKG